MQLCSEPAVAGQVDLCSTHVFLTPLFRTGDVKQVRFFSIMS